jgi:dienelactone hydrolase
MSYQGMVADTVKFRGHKGDTGEAYYAWPTGPGKFPGVVLIHHMPGWDEWITEAVRKLAHHGFATIAPHLYFREGPAALTMSARAFAPRAAWPTSRWSATRSAPRRICACNRIRTARSA